MTGEGVKGLNVTSHVYILFMGFLKLIKNFFKKSLMFCRKLFDEFEKHQDIFSTHFLPLAP